MKNFYGAISLAARIDFTVEADSLEEAKEKIFKACCVDIKFLDENDHEADFTVEQIDWNLIEEPQRGNVREEYIDGFEIEEDE